MSPFIALVQNRLSTHCAAHLQHARHLFDGFLVYPRQQREFVQVNRDDLLRRVATRASLGV
jgi:hypothetical protein